ncbi:sulfate adenylyltransferase [Proteobacteria bacterium 005FR1]|nr:sulfate adenylyltransferase [Proteobacteria bacterium 005FR1]
MLHTLGSVLRMSFGVVVLLAVSAGCSTLVGSQEQALRDHVAKNHDVATVQRVESWLSLRKRLRQQSSLTDLEKVRLVNDFFNAIPWRADADIWEVEDYWATPLEMLVKNAGDCEDFAIAKFFTLLNAGFDPDRLRLTYVWQLAADGDGREQAHMVLAFLPDKSPGMAPGRSAEPLILDNVDKDLLRLSERGDLQAVYSFNENKLWLAEDLLQPVNVASQARLRKWRKVNQRLSAEGGPRSL